MLKKLTEFVSDYKMEIFTCAMLLTASVLVGRTIYNLGYSNGALEMLSTMVGKNKALNF